MGKNEQYEDPLGTIENHVRLIADGLICLSNIRNRNPYSDNSWRWKAFVILRYENLAMCTRLNKDGLLHKIVSQIAFAGKEEHDKWESEMSGNGYDDYSADSTGNEAAHLLMRQKADRFLAWNRSAK